MKIWESRKDQRKLFRLTRNLLGTETFFQKIYGTLLWYLIADLVERNYKYFIQPQTLTEIKELIFKSPNKSSDLNPLPTWLLKKCTCPLLHPIPAIIKRSLVEGVMPSSLKHRFSRNLEWKKKIRVATDPYLVFPFWINYLYDRYQSAYRKDHTTVTALIKIHSDMSGR